MNNETPVKQLNNRQYGNETTSELEVLAVDLDLVISLEDLK